AGSGLSSRRGSAPAASAARNFSCTACAASTAILHPPARKLHLQLSGSCRALRRSRPSRKHLLPCRAASRYHLSPQHAGRGQTFDMMSLWIAQASAAAGEPGQGWLIDPELVDPGYSQTMAGGDIQTRFPVAPPPPETPEWLKTLFEAIGEFFRWSAPALK